MVHSSIALCSSSQSAAEMLERMSAAYALKVPAGYALKVNIQVEQCAGATADPNGIPDNSGALWHVVSGEDGVAYGPGLLDAADTTLSMAYDTLHKLCSGQWSGLTAAGRANFRDPAPLEFSLPPGTHPLEAMRRGYFFVTHFFSVDVPTRIRFGPGNTRKIHGAGAAALFYTTGLRSAYYCVTPDDKLNEDGARDPLHQAFIIIGGKGMATIGEQRFAVEAGEAVYIPPDTVHMLETGGPDPLELIWLAWGERA